MFRVRLASLAAATGLGLVCGCAGMSSNQTLFGRLCGRHLAAEACVIDAGVCADPCGAGCGVVGDGPILMDRGPIMVQPSTPPDVPLVPELVAAADEVPGRAEQAAELYGFPTATRDWREVAADPDVAAVSIAAPNFLHREIGVAMARAGKHIWIEKPVGLTADDGDDWLRAGGADVSSSAMRISGNRRTGTSPPATGRRV